jgi:hypothetical protein
VGLLDFFFGGGGGALAANKKMHGGRAPFGFGQMFGQQQQPGGMPFGFGGAQQQPMTFGQRFASNDDMLLALGAGLLNHRQNATAAPLGDAFLGAMQGRRIDREERRTSERENKTLGWLKRTFNLSDEDAQAASSNPEAMSYYIKRASGIEPTDDMREWAFARDNPEFASWMDNRRPETNINLAGEKSWDTETNKLFAGDYVDLQKGARQSSTMIGRLDRMEQLLADPNVFTGALWRRTRGRPCRNYWHRACAPSFMV